MTLVIYCILFYGFWAVLELLIKNQLLVLTDNNNVIMELIRSGIIKNLVWTVPAIILVKRQSIGVRLPTGVQICIRGLVPSAITTQRTAIGIILVPARSGIPITEQRITCFSRNIDCRSCRFDY